MTPYKYYAYAILDTSTTPPTLVAVELSRRLAKQFIESVKGTVDTSKWRVRRAKLTTFES